MAPTRRPGIDGLIAKALARDPGARFHSPMELRQALANLQAGVASGVSAVGPGADRPRARARRSTARGHVRGAAAAPVAAAGPARRLAQAQARAEAQQVQAPQAQAPAAARPPRRHRRSAGRAAARSRPAPDGRRSTFGRSFNVAEVAGGAVDDAQERWLIQKDRLDFGPFSLAQIRAQIQRGEIIGEHMIVDSDTGARKKVKDFAPLRDFARHSERQIEQNRRAHAEIKPREVREGEVARSRC